MSIFDTATKYCGDCKAWLPLTSYYARTNGNPANICKACRASRANRNYYQNRDRALEKMRESRLKIRLEMISAYGNRCVLCGQSRWEFLTLDHVDGGGKTHQRMNHGSLGILRELKRHGWPKNGFRLLCWNCNCAAGLRQRGAIEDTRSKSARSEKCPRCGGWKLGKRSYCNTCQNILQRERRKLIASGAILPDGPMGLGVLKGCPKCGLWMTLSSFHRGQDWCKSCMNSCRLANRENLLHFEKVRDDKVMAETFSAYGGHCCCCGETDFRLLTIDHAAGDGAKKRREGERRGCRLYRQLKSQGFPKSGYRLLCFNCNCSRGSFGYCPHELEPKPA